MNVLQPLESSEMFTSEMEGLALQDNPLLEALQKVFGFQQFREGQCKVVERIMEGGDGIVLMPTGGGKTLTFALPAVITSGTTIIICTTLSLSLIQDLHERLYGKCTIFALTGDSTDAEKDSLAIEIQTAKSMLLTTTPVAG